MPARSRQPGRHRRPPPPHRSRRLLAAVAASAVAIALGSPAAAVDLRPGGAVEQVTAGLGGPATGPDGTPDWVADLADAPYLVLTALADERRAQASATGPAPVVDDRAEVLADELAARQAVERQRRAVLAESRARAARATRAASGKWVSPVSDYRLTAGFGGFSPLWRSSHTGSDFATTFGAPVLAASGGVVVEAAYDGAYGRKLVIRHADGTLTWYCHLSRFARTSGGVMPGTVIGYVGNSGNSTGAHLHLEVHPAGGDPVDPLRWLRAHGVRL